MRISAIVFSQPKHSSIRFLFLWLMALGAARDYVPDADWQDEVQHRIQAADLKGALKDYDEAIRLEYKP